VSEYHVIRTALIDADYLAHEAAAWAHATQADAFDLMERVQATVKGWAAQACCRFWVVLYSDSRENNFRRDHYPLYKAHRTGDPPAMLEIARQCIRDMSARTYTAPRLEADDLMGIMGTNGRIENPVLVTRDKDLRQIPGWHLNPYAEDFPVYVSRREADLNFCAQWLQGDAVDGFPGIKGVGPKRARKIIGDPDSLRIAYQRCTEAYEESGKSRDQCLAQARCARILRACDWDPDARVAVPWTPERSLEQEGDWNE